MLLKSIRDTVGNNCSNVFAFKDVALIPPKYNLVEVGYPLFKYPFPNTISYLSNLGKTKSLGMHSTFGILNDNTAK
jgi:hypothetical protein